MAVYVYAITGESHPLRLDDLTGVRGPDDHLRVVRGDSLRAVVGEAPEEIKPDLAGIEAHHAVQERLCEDGATLPLSFGFVADDEDAVRTVLEQRGEQFAQRLEEIGDRVEFNVKGTQDEETVLRHILEESEPARRLNEATRNGGGTYDQRIELGEVVANEVQARQQAVAESVLAALRPRARSERLSDPSQQYFVNVSYLVDRDHAEEFRKATEGLMKDRPDGVELRVRGPLPPYSFV
ncbi:GvpL/GvpF family gas vesicle protein [Streptomyces exfoliatus]|uniref:GvpL/GvpF family gas vesicle protein n=1 Tax=Streptomyces exfoliatus TaxID=1905 RepID=A0ABV3D6X5_STREX